MATSCPQSRLTTFRIWIYHPHFQQQSKLVSPVLPNLLTNSSLFLVELLFLSLGDIAAVGILVSALLLMNSLFFGPQLTIVSTEMSLVSIGATTQIAITVEHFCPPRVILGKPAGMSGQTDRQCNQRCQHRCHREFCHE